MTRLALIVAAAFAIPAFTHAEDKSDHAKATLKDAKGEKVGTAKLTEMKEGVKIAVEVSKMTPGNHGIHVHAIGKCEGPEFKSAGGHFNPMNKQHGLHNPEGSHGGDLPNIVVGADGTGKGEFLAQGLTLKGAGDISMFHKDGTALVVHASEDDEKSDPAGNSGARVACGAVQR